MSFLRRQESTASKMTGKGLPIFNQIPVPLFVVCFFEAASSCYRYVMPTAFWVLRRAWLWNTLSSNREAWFSVLYENHHLLLSLP